MNVLSHNPKIKYKPIPPVFDKKNCKTYNTTMNDRELVPGKKNGRSIIQSIIQVQPVFRLLFVFILTAALLTNGCGMGSFFEIKRKNKIGKCYYRDKTGIQIKYVGGYPTAKVVTYKVRDADPKTFKLFKDSPKGNCGLSHIYGVDKKGMFYRTQRIEGAIDPANFKVLGNGYAKDLHNAYYRHERIEGAHPTSFAVVGTGKKGFHFARDAGTLYYVGEPLEGNIDTATFEVLEAPYSRDAHSVYLGRSLKPIPNSDPATFTTMRIPKSMGTFVHWAKDSKRAYYYYNMRLTILDGIHSPTFKALSRKYAKDKNHAYYETKIIEGADPATFKVPRRNLPYSAEDRFRKYGKGIPK